MADAIRQKVATLIIDDLGSDTDLGSCAYKCGVDASDDVDKTIGDSAGMSCDGEGVLD